MIANKLLGVSPFCKGGLRWIPKLVFIQDENKPCYPQDDGAFLFF